MSRVVIARGKDIARRTELALKTLNPQLPPKGSRVLIKPNLVEPMDRNSGAVTRPEVVEGIIKFLKDYEIFIGEGAGIFNTDECFEKAGYYELEERFSVKLVDLNKGPFIKLKGDFWEFEVAKLAKNAEYIVSAAVLKQHAFGVTLCLKNVMGLLKPQGKYPVKAYIHKESSLKLWAERLCDLVAAIKPNLAVIDATTGMFGSHLDGWLRKLDMSIASEDAVAADLVGAELLGNKNVYYLNLALKKKIGSHPRDKIQACTS
jgi:uncharacterized protein (DUF362 family)